MNPLLVSVVYAVVGVIVLPLVFSMFKTQYDWIDVILASVISAAASLIPTIGDPISMAVMVIVLYWRIGGSIFPDIIVAVGVARLAMVPALLLMNKA